MTTSTTCQICGRIAHRGYRRPGQGWQTASCSGALGLPYEVSCDLLPPTIAAVETFIASTERRLRDLLAEPPAPFVLQRRDAWGKPIGQPFDAARPDGFALDRPVPAVGRAARTYGQEFRRRRREL